VDLLFRHFWVAFVVVIVLNTRAWWRDVQEPMRRRPELAPGYRWLLRAQLSVTLVPVLLMGLGVISGQVRGVHDYLRPGEGNPFVLLWWGVVAAIVLLTTGWVVLGPGAEMLERHPGVIMVPRASARTIRLFSLGVAALNLVGMALFFGGFPAPIGPRTFDVPWIGILFPFFFAGMWVAIGFILATTGGWQTVAAHYPLVGDAPPPVQRFGAAEFGLAAYNGVLRLAADQRGLYFAVIWLFRAGHRPFVVPWSDVTARATRRWFRAVVELRFARTPDIAVRLPRASAEALFRHGGRPADFPPIGEGRAC
jgi:hypothetical protein